MKTIAIFAAVFLTAFVALPAHASGGSCPTDSNPQTDVAGVAYERISDNTGWEGVAFYYLETNGVAGLQYGAAHEVGGWSELSEEGGACKDGDLLLY